jgi:nucleotide-binding universal stress UspA family protein
MAEHDRLDPPGPSTSNGGTQAGEAGRRSATEDRAPHVVVGIDGSPASRAALHWALQHAQLTGAEVHAVAVWHRPVQFGANALARTPEKDFEAEARGWLTAVLREPGPPEHRAPVHPHTEQGDPSEVLLDHARDAELLVVGNEGRGAFAGALLGSVALRVAHRARCPVVLVPASATGGDSPEARQG